MQIFSSMKVDFSKTYLSSLLSLDNKINSSIFKIFSYLSSIFGILALFYITIGEFIWPSYLYKALSCFLLVTFLINLGYLGYYGFLKNFLSKVHFISDNLADFLELALYRDLKEYKEAIYSSDLGLELLKYPEINLFLWRLEIDTSWLRDVLFKNKGTLLKMEDLLYSAFLIALSLGKSQIDKYSLFLALLRKDPFLASLVNKENIEEFDLFLLAKWFDEKKEGFFDLKFTGGIAKDWAVGYSPLLDRFAYNLAFAALENWEILAHKNLKEDLKKVLLESRRGNILLVGRPGIGKRSLAIALAKDLAEGKCPYSLAYKRILEVQMDQLFTVGKDAAGIRGLFGEIIDDVYRAGDAILYFDDFSVVIGGGEALGKADLSDLIIPYLKDPRFRIIASISRSDFEHYVSRKEALLEEFNVIEVKEPTYSENILILEGLAAIIEGETSALFSYLALKQILDLSHRYIWQEPFPLKSIHLLEKVAQNSLSKGINLIRKEVVSDAFEEITKIKVGKIKTEERGKLINLEKILHQRVVDQDEAIKAIAEAIRMRRAEVTLESRKPIGSFLFLGPTGVGKTETAKTLAETYFGSDHLMIRFDMSEYQNKFDVYRFIGDPKSGLPGQLVEAVKNNPFALILLDEIEKAHPDILNLFLQVLDEGFITDVFGQKIYFTNHLIIATSNAGSNFLVSLLQKNLSYQQITSALSDFLIKEGIFKAEFLNRFDKIIYFKPLTENELFEIAKLKISALSRELYERKRLELEVDEGALRILSRMGYKPEFGARELERVIREKIEALVAKRIIEKGIERGKLVITSNDLKNQ